MKKIMNRFLLFLATILYFGTSNPIILLTSLFVIYIHISEIIISTNKLLDNTNNISKLQVALYVLLQSFCLVGIYVFTWLTFVEKKQIIQTLI